VKSALLRYRVLAYLVGVMLLVLVFVAVPLHYLRDSPGLSQVVSPIHGFLFFVYVLVTFDLSRYTKWSLPRTLLIMISGTIPFMSFVMEHKVNAEVTAELAAQTGELAT